MKCPLATLAAALLCASAAFCGPARAQAPAQQPAQQPLQQPLQQQPAQRPVPQQPAQRPAQQPASPRTTAAAAAHAPAAKAPGSRAPAANAPGSRGPAGARAARPQPVYRVELVIFRATSALGAPEDWAVEAGTAPGTSTDADPGDTAASGAASGSAQPSGTQPSGTQPNGTQPSGTQPNNVQPNGAQLNGVVRILPSSQFELDGVASRLRASGRYASVAHIAWAQTASPWGKPLQIPVQSVGLDAQGITGTVALERGVFLHLALDLRYAMSDPPAGLDAPPGTVFVLDQSHRVKLKERNYFDHPAFGVIALVTSDRAASRTGR